MKPAVIKIGDTLGHFEEIGTSVAQQYVVNCGFKPKRITITGAVNGSSYAYPANVFWKEEMGQTYLYWNANRNNAGIQANFGAGGNGIRLDEVTDTGYKFTTNSGVRGTYAMAVS